MRSRYVSNPFCLSPKQTTLYVYFFQDFFPDFFKAYLGLLFINEIPFTVIYLLIFPPPAVCMYIRNSYLFKNQSKYIARYGSPATEVLLLSNLIFFTLTCQVINLAYLQVYKLRQLSISSASSVTQVSGFITFLPKYGPQG